MGQCMSREEAEAAGFPTGELKSKDIRESVPRKRLSKVFHLAGKTSSERSSTEREDLEDGRFVLSPTGTSTLTEATLSPFADTSISKHWKSPAGVNERDPSDEEDSDEDGDGQELLSLTGSFDEATGPVIHRVQSKSTHRKNDSEILRQVTVFSPEEEVIEEEEDPGAPSDEDSSHEEEERMEPGRLMSRMFRRKSRPPPHPLVTSSNAVVLSSSTATRASAESLHPMQFSQFQKLKVQADMVVAHQKKQGRADKVDDRMQDVEGYRKLWNEYKEIQKMGATPNNKSRRKVKRSNSFDLQDTDSWFFNFQYPEYDLDQKVEGENDYYDVHDNKSQASLSLLSESSMDAQRRLFAEKRRMRMKSLRSTPKQPVVDVTPLRKAPRPDYGPAPQPIAEIMEVSFRSPNEDDEKASPGGHDDDAGSVVSDLADDTYDTTASAINRNDYADFRQFAGGADHTIAPKQDVEVVLEPEKVGLTVIGLAPSERIGSSLLQATTLMDKFGQVEPTTAQANSEPKTPVPPSPIESEQKVEKDENARRGKSQEEKDELNDAENDVKLWTPRPHPATSISNYSSIYGMSTEAFFLSYAEESPLMANWEEARRRVEGTIIEPGEQPMEPNVVTPTEQISAVETRLSRLVESRKRNRVQLELLRRYGGDTDANKSLQLADRVAKQVNDVLSKYREPCSTIEDSPNTPHHNQANSKDTTL